MKKFLSLMLAVLMVLSLVACGGNNEGEGEGTAAKDTLTVAMQADADTLDPSAQNYAQSSMVIRQIFDTLLYQDQECNLHPSLAESWEYEDDCTLVLHLKKGVKFTNGEELSADDVLFTIERALGSAKCSSFVSAINIDKCEAVDDYTVKLATDAPYAALLSVLSHTSISIVNREAVEAAGDQVDFQPVGTGPFELVKWISGDQFILKRNENYWGEKPAFENLIIRVITENANRSIEVETGGVDIALNVPTADYDRLAANPDVNIYKYNSLMCSGLQMNTQVEPWNDVRVRQAMNYACDIETIGKTIYGDVGQRQSAPMSTDVWACNTNLTPYEYNPEKAKELLTEAGYPNGFDTTVHIYCGKNQARLDALEIIMNQLKPLGIDCEVEIADAASGLGTDLVEYEMFFVGWGVTTGDPDMGLYQTFNSNSHTANSRRIQFYDPDIIALLEAGRAETDESKREQYYLDAQELIWDAAPWLFYWNEGTIDVTAKNVKGFNPHHHGYYHIFSTVYFE